MNAEETKMFFDKAKQQLGLLKDYYYRDFTDVSDLSIWQDEREDKRLSPDEATWTPTQLGAHWSGRDAYYWLHFAIPATAIPAGEHLVLHLDLGRTGGGNNSGFEGLVFVNGKPRQAVDSNHEDLYFGDDNSDQVLTVYIKLWTGLEGGGPQKIQHYTLNALCYGIIDQAVVDAWDYLSNITEVIRQLGPDEPLKYAYITLLKQCFQQFVWADLDTTKIRPVAEHVMTMIHEFIAAHPNQKKGYQITAVGHTHIDVAWLWRLRHTREKVARSFSTGLELMKEYPDYIFFQSTPQDYAFLEEDYPDLYRQIQDRIKEGRWEANGGTWLEPDTNIPSGESLTRQFLYGSGYFHQRFNARQNVLWLPDVFGYSAALPQIMQGFGVANFMTTKISWNDTNRMPHDTFYWQGIDGTKVLTHFITTVESNGEESSDGAVWRYTYNGQIRPQTVVGSYHVYADKPVNDHLLISYGYGDGGGGPAREDIKNVAIINELPGMPIVKQGRVDDFFDGLNERLAKSPEPVATWQGELYLEYHRGTYTSQANVKKWNRRADLALRDLEIRYTIAHVEKGIAYPTEKIRALWVILLRNQFHDILPGSAIAEVYEDAAKEFQALFDGVADLAAALNQTDMQTANGMVIANPLPWSRTALVPVDQAVLANVEQDIQAETVAGQALTQVTIPALSEQALTNSAPVSTSEKQEATQVSTGQIETPFYVITYSANGQLTQLHDKRTGRDILGAGGGNVLTIYEDKPAHFDNWNLDADYPEKATVLTADHSEISANNRFFTEVTATYHIGHSALTQRVRVYTDSPRLDFLTHVSWHERQRVLRVAFNSTVLADNARFDIQYGNVLRPTNDNTSWDTAKFETVGHKWADLSERDYGVALLNDCKYGYRVKDKQLSLTLLKSGNYPDTKADEGEHTFTYSLLPHEGDFLAGEVEKQAEELNQPLTVATGVAAPTLTPLFNFVGDYPVALDAIKVSENGDYVVVRVHDYSGTHSRVTITVNQPAKAAYAGKLDETRVSDDDLLQDGQIKLTLRPYEVATVLVKF